MSWNPIGCAFHVMRRVASRENLSLANSLGRVLISKRKPTILRAPEGVVQRRPLWRRGQMTNLYVPDRICNGLHRSMGIVCTRLTNPLTQQSSVFLPAIVMDNAYSRIPTLRIKRVYIRPISPSTQLPPIASSEQTAPKHLRMPNRHCPTSPQPQLQPH